MQVELATLSQVWAHMALRNWRPLPHEYSLVVSGVMAARVWVAVDPVKAPIVLGGVLLGPDRTLPGAWLSVAPGIGRDFLSVALGARRVLRTLRVRFPEGLRCTIRDDNRIGERLGRVLGFEPTDETFGIVRNWRLADGWSGGHVDGRQRQAAGVDGAGLASAHGGPAGGGGEPASPC